MLIWKEEYDVIENKKGDDINKIEATMLYQKGDDYKTSRAYVLMLTPTKVEDKCDGDYCYTVHSTYADTIVKVILKKVNRKSSKIEKEIIKDLTTNGDLKYLLTFYFPDYSIEL